MLPQCRAGFEYNNPPRPSIIHLPSPYGAPVNLRRDYSRQQDFCGYVEKELGKIHETTTTGYQCHTSYLQVRIVSAEEEEIMRGSRASASQALWGD
jgi:hypothetical protein